MPDKWQAGNTGDPDAVGMTSGHNTEGLRSLSVSAGGGHAGCFCSLGVSVLPSVRWARSG